MKVNAAEVEDKILENWQVTLSYLSTTLQLSTENRHKTVHEELDTAKCVHTDYQDVGLKSKKSLFQDCSFTSSLVLRGRK